ncbi:MAG TPA: ABC-2 transporter permease, partial [Bacillota bacterium]|nr:ABC-2 transporter permease [Bacillota bacterium]
FSTTTHLYIIAGLVGVAMLLSGIMLPLTFKFGTEKSRIILAGVFALPTAAVIVLSKAGLPMIPATALTVIAKLLPFLLILFYLLSYLLSVKIFTGKEI